MKRTMTILGTAALAIGMAFVQSAATQPHHNRRMTARQHMMQALNLTDAQKSQAKILFQETRQTVAPLRAQLKEDRAALQMAIKTNDKAQINKLSAAEGQVIGKLMAVRTEAMAKFYQTLTPEQRAKAEQMHHQWKTQRQARTRS